jgi:hypothetical protein
MLFQSRAGKPPHPLSKNGKPSVFLDSILDEQIQNRGLSLKADLMGYFVDMLEARLDAFFSEALKGQ